MRRRGHSSGGALWGARLALGHHKAPVRVLAAYVLEHVDTPDGRRDLNQVGLASAIEAPQRSKPNLQVCVVDNLRARVWLCRKEPLLEA